MNTRKKHIGKEYTISTNLLRFSQSVICVSWFVEIKTSNVFHTRGTTTCASANPIGTNLHRLSPSISCLSSFFLIKEQMYEAHAEPGRSKVHIPQPQSFTTSSRTWTIFQKRVESKAKCMTDTRSHKILRGSLYSERACEGLCQWDWYLLMWLFRLYVIHFIFC